MENSGVRRSGVVVQFDDGYHGFVGMAFLDKFTPSAEGGWSISFSGLCAKNRQEFYFPDTNLLVSIVML